MHLSGIKQSTGEAKYIDDLPHLENELYAGLVLSERAHATFTIDSTKIEKMEVHPFVCLSVTLLIFKIPCRVYMILSLLKMFLVVI